VCAVLTILVRIFSGCNRISRIEGNDGLVSFGLLLEGHPPPPRQAVHLKLKRMCTICGVTVTALAVHMNAVHTGRKSVILKYLNRRIFIIVMYRVLYSILLHLPPLRFHSAGGCCDRAQDCCAFGIGSQPL
jgi:hypothetical protein